MSRRQTTLQQGALFNFLGISIYRIDSQFSQSKLNSFQESFKITQSKKKYQIFNAQKMRKSESCKWTQMKS